MNRIRTGAISCVLAFLASLTLGACSVVRVDVDVYNGPLANHEEVQVEQLAAMVMGARPLLAQLRDTLQWHDGCQNPVNESYSQCILKQKNALIGKGDCRERESILEAADSYASDVRVCHLTHPAARVNELIKLYLDRTEPVTLAAKVPDETASVSSTDPANSNLSIFKDLVTTFGQQFEKPVNNGKEMKRTAVSLTRMLNLLETWNLIYEKRDGIGFELYNAIREVGNAGRPNIFEIPSEERERVMDFVFFFYGPEAARDLLELARAQPDILSVQRRATIDDQGGVVSKLEDVENDAAGSFKAFYPRDGRGALQRGRLDEGLATLIENYLVQKRTCISKFGNDCALHGTFRKYKIDKPIDAPSAARLMQEAIVRFANKLVTIADHEILLKRDGGAPQQFTGAAAQQLDENVLVLQAIGNSILAQADEIHRRRTHDVGVRDDFRKSAAIHTLATTYGINLDFNEPENSQRTAASTVEVLDQLIDRLKFMHIAATAPRESGQCEISTPRNTSENIKGIADDGTREENEKPKEVESESQANSRVSLKPDKDGSCDPCADCPEAKQIEAAIKLAYEYRSGMVYIRPPSAYLRQVFAASGLQDGSAGAWRNMLEEQGARSLPFSGLFGFEGLRGENSSERQRRIRAEIDKQFWNNINSVRLAGFGATNFVLVKDDVGNWYAKNVEADPSQIYQSVQSSLLFAVGGNVNADLLLQRNLEREALAADGGSYTKLLQNKQYVELRNQNRARFDGTSSGNLVAAFGGFREDYVKAINSLTFDVRQQIAVGVDAETGLAADLRQISAAVAIKLPEGDRSDFLERANEDVATAFADHLADAAQTVAGSKVSDLDAASVRASQIEQATGQVAALRDALVRTIRAHGTVNAQNNCDGETPDLLRGKLQVLQQAKTTADARLAAFEEAQAAQPGQFTQELAVAQSDAVKADHDLSKTNEALATCLLEIEKGINQADRARANWNELANRMALRIDGILQSWLGRQVAALDALEQAVQVMSKVAKETTDVSSAPLTPPPTDPNGAASAAVSDPGAQ